MKKKLLCILLSFSFFLTGFFIPGYQKKLTTLHASPVQENCLLPADSARVALENRILTVVPGGQSIGVLFNASGVLVVGFSPVISEKGVRLCPAASAGIKPGDIILKVNGEEVKSENRVCELIMKSGESGSPAVLEVKREKEILQFAVHPVFCHKTAMYRIGLIIRDTVAGVGTLTFYDPATGIFGALGHMVTDLNSPSCALLEDGVIVKASIEGINRGKRGKPGEKLGVFENGISGSIKANSRLGIFGYLQDIPQESTFNQPLPVASLEEIREGPAEMLTVLKGDRVEKFAVEIIKINPKARADGKGLIVRVTDRRLLEETGGIVQGMSGSPLIQDGRLIGAVTHVFVNDPSRGYGVPVQWMIEEFYRTCLGEEHSQKLAG